MDAKSKLSQLNDIAKEIAATNGGPLAGPNVNPVPGEGNPDAEILFIGEAPGFNENQQGRPFVGQAGKLLRKELAKNGFDEREVYITNIVKFRPPENRDPTPEEIAFFKPFLDKQIKTIAPKVVVTLGRFSMYKFLGEGVSISRIHGQPHTIEWDGRPLLVYPMYHPAAALRATNLLHTFEQDFIKLKELLSPTPKEAETNSSSKKGGEQLQLV